MGLFTILPIVREHYRSLVDDSSKLRTAIVFGVVPLAIGFALSIGGILLTESFTQIVISILAILVGFSINALVLLIRDEETIEKDTIEGRLMENTRNHTMYALIFGLGILSYTGALFLLQAANVQLHGVFGILGAGLLYAGLIHYIVTLYLLPARLYAIAEVLFK